MRDHGFARNWGVSTRDVKDASLSLNAFPEIKNTLFMNGHSKESNAFLKSRETKTPVKPASFLVYSRTSWMSFKINWNFATVLRVRKRFGTFKKQAPVPARNCNSAC